MKIDSSTRTAPLTENTTPVARGGKQTPQTGGADKVQLSSMSTQIQALETSINEASGFDTAKVEAIKLAISEGRYTVNPDAIADKLISSTRELLTQQKG
ncbi:MAG: flagellar biosynthesis anti-sigma factor FlgM [Methylophilaceae bacterium]|jgi:negative regulator of flagellin synthesis FlgM|uniref:flagellar biosynthesis anti-sigma factor FlgM n=1 Tax=Methylobacillus sp. MM3 TaxID=1848039 RepID=UPI0007E020E5|nr:flagellar biosynthesis anti-sigma factor FlgM [Methylobacillus sp. MM3]OAJ70826.1 flagellar biosynthesis anti-sigma factor FlgM [Methylobacillus sp. MM3]